ncbi:trafficking kinesin-binding protein 1 [Plakobranchus ocellatus]|uniref:Trafficking kinesin-binding protein 1 n=2 Tax=Plakobranchus ocellatus TaxID=259542 RepID=A0AAV4AF07_9GAST|nr:trafficking kinesin-binding protein 1 [Plakobranchus ocellatus]
MEALSEGISESCEEQAHEVDDLTKSSGGEESSCRAEEGASEERLAEYCCSVPSPAPGASAIPVCAEGDGRWIVERRLSLVERMESTVTKPQEMSADDHSPRLYEEGGKRCADGSHLTLIERGYKKLIGGRLAALNGVLDKDGCGLQNSSTMCHCSGGSNDGQEGEGSAGEGSDRDSMCDDLSPHAISAVGQWWWDRYCMYGSLHSGPAGRQPARSPSEMKAAASECWERDTTEILSLRRSANGLMEELSADHQNSGDSPTGPECHAQNWGNAGAEEAVDSESRLNGSDHNCGSAGAVEAEDSESRLNGSDHNRGNAVAVEMEDSESWLNGSDHNCGNAETVEAEDSKNWLNESDSGLDRTRLSLSDVVAPDFEPSQSSPPPPSPSFSSSSSSLSSYSFSSSSLAPSPPPPPPSPVFPGLPHSAPLWKENVTFNHLEHVNLWDLYSRCRLEGQMRKTAVDEEPISYISVCGSREVLDKVDNKEWNIMDASSVSHVDVSDREVCDFLDSVVQRHCSPQDDQPSPSHPFLSLSESSRSEVASTKLSAYGRVTENPESRSEVGNPEMTSFEDMEAADLDICDRLDLLSGESRSEGAGSVSSESSFYAESISCGPVTSVRLTSPTSFAVLFRRCRDERDALYSSSNSSSSSLQVEDPSGQGELNPEKSAADVVNVDFLEKKVKSLEDENLHLRLESANLQSATSNYEDKEKKLVEDCIQQLAEVNQQVESFAAELHLKSEENMHQKEEIKAFLSQTAGLQTKIRKLTLENMDMHEKLTASTESQRKLTKEPPFWAMRRGKLEHLVTTGKFEGKRSRGRQREKIMDGLATWLGPGKVSDILAAVKDRDLWRDMIANAYKQGT